MIYGVGGMVREGPEEGTETEHARACAHTHIYIYKCLYIILYHSTRFLYGTGQDVNEIFPRDMLSFSCNLSVSQLLFKL